MITERHMSKESETIEDVSGQAREWLARLHAGDLNTETQETFEAWIAQSTAHRNAFRDAEQIWRDFDYVAHKANLTAAEPTIFARAAAWLQAAFARPAYAVSGAVATLAMIAMVAIISMTLRAPDQLALTPDFATAVAEIREIALEDGTIVTLGAKSEINTAFSGDARRVTLLEGEAFFDVAKDAKRPFYVAADDTVVRVVGTKFDVKRSAGQVHVAVLEGIVEVMKDDTQSLETDEQASKQVLTAGLQVSVERRQSVPTASPLENIEAGAWRDGRLAYDNERLKVIVDDVNRYAERPLRIASSDLEDLRLTTAFRTSEIPQMLEVLEVVQPIEVDDNGAGPIILRRKP